MSKRYESLNPSSISDALTEDFYTKKTDKRKQLKRDRKKRVAWLRKKGKGNADLERLADKLENCRPRHRCKSLACPQCADATQRLFIRITRRYLDSASHISCVTIVPTDGILDPKHLSMADTKRFIRRTKDKLTRAFVTTFIGAVDWSKNESKEGSHKPFWCQHLHGIALIDDRKALKKALNKQFPASRNVRRPITVKEWDGEKTAIRYLMKSPAKRRISIADGQRFDKKTGRQRQCRDTDHQPLRSKDLMTLLFLLDEIGIAGRLVLKGVQFMNLRKSGPTLIDRRSRSRSRERD